MSRPKIVREFLDSEMAKTFLKKLSVHMDDEFAVGQGIRITIIKGGKFGPMQGFTCEVAEFNNDDRKNEQNKNGDDMSRADVLNDIMNS